MDSFEDLVRRIVREEIARTLGPRDRAKTAEVPRDEQQMYSVSAVAGLLAVSTDYVYDRINDGQLAVVELGGGRPKMRIAAAELNRFAASRTSRGSLG